jgi:DNA-binding NarL/FixJ family response regulator
MKASVLIVDDDPTFRQLAEELLLAAGLEVVGEADDAEAGMSTAKATRPDAILLDVMLPDGNGAVVARDFAALPWAPRVLLTSSSPDAVGPEVIDADGVVGFVSKQGLPEAPLARLLGGP